MLHVHRLQGLQMRLVNTDFNVTHHLTSRSPGKSSWPETDGDGGRIASYNYPNIIHMSVICCTTLITNVDHMDIIFSLHIEYHSSAANTLYDCTWVVSAISLETSLGMKLSEL